jgi:hypothetical protein
MHEIASEPMKAHRQFRVNHMQSIPDQVELDVRLSSREVGQKVVYFSSWVQKVVYFPSDNSDLLSSHFCVQLEVHYFWSASARILVYRQKQSILRARRVFRRHLSELSQPLIFCFVPLLVQLYCNQSTAITESILSISLQLLQSQFYTVVRQWQQRVSTTNQPFFTGFVVCC